LKCTCKAFALLLLVCGGARSALSALPVEEHLLDNGMQLLIVEDHTSPRFMGAWVAHVGSANERPGITGLTHLLEHMMFKGSRAIGTTDLERDLELIELQEELKDRMRERSRDLRWEVRRGFYETLKEAQRNDHRYKTMEAEFQRLVEEQQAVMVGNEYAQIMQRNGELFGNAFTSEDMTAYFHVMPANRIELWFWMQSDRLLNPVFREFYNERSVVYEERRMRTESTPTGVHEEALNALFWQAHPYSWPVLGWPSDVSELSLAQAEEYYRTYYGPANLTAIVAGDVDPAQVVELGERYFGRLPARDDPPPLVTLEPPQIGEKRYNGTADVNNSISMLFHCGGFKHRDSAALVVLDALLNGPTGRLERRLVQEGAVAVRAYTHYEPGKYGGMFGLRAEAVEGVSHAELEEAVLAELDRLAVEEVGERELQKVKNRYLVDAYREERDMIHRTFVLIGNAGMGDWREAEALRERIQEVRPEGLRRVADGIFRPENRTVACWSREESEEREQ